MFFRKRQTLYVDAAFCRDKFIHIVLCAMESKRPISSISALCWNWKGELAALFNQLFRRVVLDLRSR